MPAMSAPLPADDPERALLHDEVHARPSARVTDILTRPSMTPIQ